MMTDERLLVEDLMVSAVMAASATTPQRAHPHAKSQLYPLKGWRPALGERVMILETGSTATVEAILGHECYRLERRLTARTIEPARLIELERTQDLSEVRTLDELCPG